MISAPPFLLACFLAIAHRQRIRLWCAADWFRRSACDRAQVGFEIFKAHRGELFPLGGLRHRPASFRVPSNRPAATTDIAIVPSTTAQSRIMIRWSLFMIAPPELGFRQEIGFPAILQLIRNNPFVVLVPRPFKSSLSYWNSRLPSEALHRVLTSPRLHVTPPHRHE
jgi:hypothetical protein